MLQRVHETQDEAVLDDVIDRLLEVRAGRPGRQVQLSEQEVKQLCLTAKEILMSQPNLLELEAPIKICGIRAYLWDPLCLYQIHESSHKHVGLR